MRSLLSNRNNISLYAVLFIGVFVLSACATDPFAPVADAVLGKDWRQNSANGQAQTSSAGAQTSSARTSEEVCKSANIVALTDVDTAYARAMRAFHFRTWEQRKKDAERLGAIDRGFKHDATPGAFYDMADWVGVAGDNGKQYYTWMKMQLAREGVSKTLVTTKYCVPGNHPSATDPQLQATMDKAIRTAMR